MTAWLALYRRSVRELNHLTTFTLFVLLDESVYKTQREGLIRLISGTAAGNAMELASKVRTSTTQLADRLADKLTHGCHAAIWNARQKQAAAP